MFCDSHAHFFKIFEENGGDYSFFDEMKANNFRFLMDIGTAPGDLQKRKDSVLKANNGKFPDFIYFTVGLWPHTDSIANPQEALAAFKVDIESHLKTKPEYSGIGECGLDRYWNGQDAFDKGRTVGTMDIEGEEFLFKEQLRFAKEKKLSVVIHSRDAFDDTLKCIDEVNYHRGIIHCYSYGIEEAKEFIKRGWFISFPGTITYYKKQKDKDKIIELLKLVPKKQFLLETDAPYLAPVPFRGKLNNPNLIEYTYAFASEILNVSISDLSDLVLENCKAVFKVDNRMTE